jgi:hypothetical protein
MRVRPEVIYNYLLIKRAVQPGCEDLVVPTLQAVQALVAGVADLLMTKAQRITDPKSLAIEKVAISSNVAKVDDQDIVLDEPEAPEAEAGPAAEGVEASVPASAARPAADSAHTRTPSPPPARLSAPPRRQGDQEGAEGAAADTGAADAADAGAAGAAAQREARARCFVPPARWGL